jgi:hypothetical protein
MVSRTFLALVGAGASHAYMLPLSPRFAVRLSPLMMADDDELVPLQPTWNDPREGKPFGNADRDDKTGLRKGPLGGGVRLAQEAYQPRGIGDATVLKPQYIGIDDEPWHSTCRSTTVITKADLAQGEAAMLPFVAPEAALNAATRAAKDAAEMTAAIAKALKDGARPGCPDLVAAEKVAAAFEKDDAKGAEKAKPKAPKPPGAQGKGWDDMARAVGKTHDNSVA